MSGVDTPGALIEGSWERYAFLFEKSFGEPGLGQLFDVSPDGQRFAVVEKIAETPAPTELVLVQNFGEALKRLVPASR